MKRFYKMVSYHETAHQSYCVTLDGKSVKTPAKQDLLCPTEALAQGIAAEWAAQQEHIDPETMPLTQILTTQIDVVAHQRADMQDEVLKYLDTDLVCYRTDEPQAMGDAQNAAWNRWVDWLSARYNAKLQITTGLAALKQDQTIHAQLREDVLAMDDTVFTVFQMLTPLTGSVILALAFVSGQASPDDLYHAANVEEEYRAKIYNEDFYGAAPHQEKKQHAMRRDLQAARDYLFFSASNKKS